MKIAVLICGLVFDSQKAFMKGIERRIRDWGDICSVFCCHVNVAGNATYTKGEYSIFDLPDFTKFDGIVFVRNVFQNPTADNRLIERIKDSKVPCVCIDSYSPDFVNIVSDEYACQSDVTKHLIQVHECKKLYYLAGPESSSDAVVRFNGFKETLEANGIEFKDEWCTHGNFQYSSGVSAAEYFLNLPDGIPDAIVCANDEMAVGLCNELKRRGMRVPRDIRVTGIDFDSVSRVFTPRLTTIKRQQYQKGISAVNILHEFDEHAAGEKIFSPGLLFCGETCGCKQDEEAKVDTATSNSLAIDRYSQSELTQKIKSMTADLMSKRDYYSLLDELKEYACDLCPDELYVCMNARPEIKIDYTDYASTLSLIDHDNQEDYSDEMIAVVTCINGTIPENDEREYFERSDLFPPAANGGKSGGTYYFLPIHYLNRNFGYAILGTSGELIRNDFFPNWCTIASNAFENSRKRSVMEQMITALDHMWIYDTLTGIYNRAGFFKLSECIIDECVRDSVPICVVFMDVDGLKTVNDKYGHDEGDVLIKNVAQILKDVKRHGEIIMRYGGDEFVLLAANYTDENAKECVRKLEAAIARCNDSSGKPYEVDVSIGYCITTLTNKDELNLLIENADRKMYINKNIKKAERNVAPR